MTSYNFPMPYFPLHCFSLSTFLAAFMCRPFPNIEVKWPCLLPLHSSIIHSHYLISNREVEDKAGV